MRSKRSKKYRRTMQYYGITFGFREPYQVLVDSHHLRAVHAFKMPLERFLTNTLHGTAKPFVTRCTLASILQTTDLHSPQRPKFLPPPKMLPLRHCSHAGVAEDDVLPEDECLLDLLRGGVTGNQQPKNKQHFVLATADPGPLKNDEQSDELHNPHRPFRKPNSTVADGDIRAYAREIPGVPIIYVKRSVMILEEFSHVSMVVRMREEKEKFRQGITGKPSRKRKIDDEDHGGEASGPDQEVVAPKKEKKAKKLKGPNPLSVLKKKPKAKRDAQQKPSKKRAAPEESGVDGDSAEADQARKARKKGKVQEAPVDGPEAVYGDTQHLNDVAEV